MKALDHGSCRIGGEFDLDSPPFPGPIEEEVGFDAVGCAEKIGLGAQTKESQRGEDLLDHETFPTVTHPRLIVEMLDVLHIQQGVEQTAIAPVEAGCFDKALVNVSKPRTHTANQKSLLQKIAISHDGLVIDSQCRTEFRGIQGLGIHGRQHTQQATGALGLRGEAPLRQIPSG